MAFGLSATVLREKPSLVAASPKVQVDHRGGEGQGLPCLWTGQEKEHITRG